MHTRISLTVVIVLVTTVVLVLITAASFSTNQVLAWNHEKKNSNSQNNFGDTSSTGATSKIDLKGLFACISHVANGINSLTQNEVLNCYMQTLPSNNGSNNTGPSLTSGNNNQIETSDSG